MALAYDTMDTNAVLVVEAKRWLAEVLADHGSGLRATPREREPRSGG